MGGERSIRNRSRESGISARMSWRYKRQQIGHIQHSNSRTTNGKRGRDRRAEKTEIYKDSELMKEWKKKRGDEIH